MEPRRVDRWAANVDIRGQGDRLPRRQHKTTHTSGSIGQIKLLAHVDIRVVVELGHGWGRPPRTPPSSGDRQRLSHANKGRLTCPPRHQRSELGRARRADASGQLQSRAGATRPTPIVAGFQLGPSRRRSTRRREKRLDRSVGNDQNSMPRLLNGPSEAGAVPPCFARGRPPGARRRRKRAPRRGNLPRSAPAPTGEAASDPAGLPACRLGALWARTELVCDCVKRVGFL